MGPPSQLRRVARSARSHADPSGGALGPPRLALALRARWPPDRSRSRLALAGRLASSTVLDRRRFGDNPIHLYKLVCGVSATARRRFGDDPIHLYKLVCGVSASASASADGASGTILFIYPNSSAASALRRFARSSPADPSGRRFGGRSCSSIQTRLRRQRFSRSRAMRALPPKPAAGRRGARDSRSRCALAAASASSTVGASGTFLPIYPDSTRARTASALGRDRDGSVVPSRSADGRSTCRRA